MQQHAGTRGHDRLQRAACRPQWQPAFHCSMLQILQAGAFSSLSQLPFIGCASLLAVLRRYGMRMGFDMRQQAVAAVQAKVLRLNSVAVADQTAGKVGGACRAAAALCTFAHVQLLRLAGQLRLAAREEGRSSVGIGQWPAQPLTNRPFALQIVNIVSNDVRRFDDALPFYNFLICSPGACSGGSQHQGWLGA